MNEYIPKALEWGACLLIGSWFGRRAERKQEIWKKGQDANAQIGEFINKTYLLISMIKRGMASDILMIGQDLKAYYIVFLKETFPKIGHLLTDEMKSDFSNFLSYFNYINKQLNECRTTSEEFFQGIDEWEKGANAVLELIKKEQR